MQQVVNINGYETVIEVPEGQVLSPVTYSGSKDNYQIDYGNGLIEVGGIAQVECTEVTTGIIEGTKVIDLEGQVLDFQATAMNIVNNPEILTGESAFIAEVSNGYKIYATAKSTSSATIPVKWSGKLIK